MTLSLGQASKEIGIPKPTIYRHIKKGRDGSFLSASQVNGRWQIDKSELHRFYADTVQDRKAGTTLKSDETSDMASAMREKEDEIKRLQAALDAALRLNEVHEDRISEQSETIKYERNRLSAPDSSSGIFTKIFGKK